MSTSSKPEPGSQALKTGFVYLLVSLLCALLGAVYESFSHGVYANPMIYAFSFPLCLGALPFIYAALLGLRAPCRLAANLYHAGLAALTAGSFMTGVLEIYGTTNDLITVYWIAGSALTTGGIVIHLVNGRRQKES